jgi:hypothetical protein
VKTWRIKVTSKITELAHPIHSAFLSMILLCADQTGKVL